jgi:methionine biosynthesis protein MetW
MDHSKYKTYTDAVSTAIIYVPEKKNLKILDLGCGSGSAGAFIKNRQDATVIGITLSETEKKIAELSLDDCTVYDLEKGLPEFSAIKFDVVIMSHVLEHICYPEKLLADIKNILNHKGIVIVVVPNIMHYRSRFELIKGNFEYERIGVWDYTHFRWYTVQSVGRLFDAVGYKTVVNDVTVPLPFGRLLNKIPSDNIKNSIRSFLKSISKGLFGSEIIYVFEIEAVD